MSISINNNLHTQSYNPTAKSGKATAGGFAIPDMKDTSVTDESESQVSGKIGVDDYGMIQNHLRSQVQMLPPDIMNGNALLKFQETQTAKIVFEFGEGGSIRIKEGISPADYARAKAALRDYEFWLNGGTLPPK